MRFRCVNLDKLERKRKARKERFDRRRNWHLWFAWHPADCGDNTCVWLEKVWRIGTPIPDWPSGYEWHWRYKKHEDR